MLRFGESTSLGSFLFVQMTRKPAAPFLEFLSGLILLVGFGVAFLLLWFVTLVLLAGLLYAGLSVVTNWSVVARIGFSFFAALVILKAVALVGAVFDVIPESWVATNRKTKATSTLPPGERR
ncbi:hypothetical protein RBSH_00207 [Rhodopirellula baltica SH28]|uniref:Uncharacterized protein n=2 Tax=Rhodopirellula baltica TaxID=265606 RepID=K5EEZ5_RHOBT|nr:hypothetical protein RBSH_00207 [Rhodopirellula baltica SH28]